ncbi:unnamed protein product [Symbiodinium sp. CCMP2592]|nr:unnamed protein product [Symbiodinium sp. CCMP2592]
MQAGSVQLAITSTALTSRVGADDPLLPRRDYTRTCTLSWTHELGRQTYGFAVAAPQLGAYVECTSPWPEVQIHLWLPGQGPVHMRVGARHMDMHLSAYLGAFLPDCEYGLHVAYDSNPQVLDLVVAPPSPVAWWILRDSIGCELLRPVIQHYTSHCSFFFCTVEPDGVVLSVEPSAEVRQMSPSPHGARALISRALPGLIGQVIDGTLLIVAAKAGPLVLGHLAMLLLTFHAAAMQPPQAHQLVPVAEVAPTPSTMRIWTLNVPQPVDLPWRPQGYQTRWLRELMCRLHHIPDPGEFRSTHSQQGGTVQHVLFVPVVPPTLPTARFWLLHWGAAAVVTFGHSPFNWEVVYAHLRTLFQGGQLPERCPTLAYAGQFYAPGTVLPDFPSGAIIQILVGALERLPGDDDPWNPEPFVVESPYFRHIPSRGPALEPAIVLDGHGNRLAAGALQSPLVDQGVQTDLSGNGTGLDHATVSRVHHLSQELSFHTARLWAGLAEPDAEPAGDNPPVLRLSSQSACAADTSTADLLDLSDAAGSQAVCRLPWAALLLLGVQVPRALGAVGSLLVLATLNSGSIITPPQASSEEEQVNDTAPPAVQATNMSAADWAPAPVVRPAGPPPPEPVNAPFQPHMMFLRAARPLEDYALRQWPSTVDREPAADEDTVRRVQADLQGLRCGIRTLAAAIPLGTPFCIHNPFTARQQCELVEYSAGPEINPFVLFEGHARGRGWAGLVLLQPQPDARAVHLIGCPQAAGNVAVGVAIEHRLIPCCLPATVDIAALRALRLDGTEYDLRPPEVQEGTQVVQFRNGDCLSARRHVPRRSHQGQASRDPAAVRGTVSAGERDASPADESAAIAASPSLWASLLLVQVLRSRLGSTWLVAAILPSLVQSMHRPGGFPWGTDSANRVFSGITAEDPVYVVLHSPFLGVFPPYTASQETPHSQVWAQFRNDDPGWAEDFFPVWPGPAFNELSIVPIGRDPALVTLMLIWRGHHRATLVPRTMTVDWITSFTARHINSAVGGVSLPHGLAVCELFDVPPAAFRFRNGDVVYVHDPLDDPDEPLELVEPWHLQDGLAAHHAPWAVGFQLMFPISVHLLRPEKPPLLTTIPAGESWCPEAFSFSGEFQHHFPGMWTPVQWTSARALQLIEVNGVAARVNVVAATPEGRLCRTVDRIASRHSVADQLHFCPDSIQVGGVPAYALDQACELRNGDVVFGAFDRSACPRSPGSPSWWLGVTLTTLHLSQQRQTCLPLLVGYTLSFHAGLSDPYAITPFHAPHTTAALSCQSLIGGSSCSADEDPPWSGMALGCASSAMGGPQSWWRGSLCCPILPGVSAALLFSGLRGIALLAASACIPASQAMLQQASASSATVPAAAAPRVTVTVANPFAPWNRVEADPRNLFDDVVADAHHTLASWHQGFAATGLVLDSTQVVVPLPGRRLVCLLVQGMGQLLCVILPAFMTPRDLTQAIQMRLGKRVSVSLLPGLAATVRASRPVLALRSGDIIAIRPLQLDPLAGPRNPPVFLTWGAAHAAAAWHSDFLVAQASCVLLWSPGRPTRVALLRHQARWIAAAAAVHHHEQELGTHRWAPCHGHLGAPPWLVEQSEVAGRANIIQSCDSTRCIEVERDAHDLHISGYTVRPASSHACRTATVRDGDWWVHSAAVGLLGRHLSFPAQLAWLLYSLAAHAWAGSSSCPSVDSSEARTIRTRRRPSRSRSPGSQWPGRFFPPRVDFNDGEPYVPQSGWQPDAPDGPLARCFPGPRPQTARVLCPLRGWSELLFINLAGTWREVEHEGARHCGLWSRRFFPVRAVLPVSQLTLAPVAPYGLATVVFHMESCSAVALASVDSSLVDLQRLAARVFTHARYWRVVAPPVLRAANPHTHLRLRNGDAFSLVPEQSQPEATRFPLLQYPSLERARQVASWSLPFRFDSGGLVVLWYSNRRHGHYIRIRDTGYWDPEGPTFWSLNGEALSGSWVPVLTGDLSSLHLVHQASVGEAHVLFLLPPDLMPQGRRLAGCNAYRAPPGWRLLPALQYVRADSPLRDGDVLVIDPDASVVWDPFGPLPSAAVEESHSDWPSCSSPSGIRGAGWLAFLAVAARWPRWLTLALLSHYVCGMVPVLEVPDRPIRTGLYPWRAKPGEEDLVDLSPGTEIDVVYLSPFTGPREAGRLPTVSTLEDLSSLARACDPEWAAGVAPVWPTAAIPALLVVPRPLSLDMVCLAISSLDQHFSILTPCVTSVSWLSFALRFLQPMQTLSVRAPSPLTAEATTDQNVRWRSGDLVVALPPAAFVPEYQPPCFHSDTQVRHCAIWSVDFSVSFRANFVLWQPGVRAVRGHAPAGARWQALDFTFEGEFRQHYPGRWVPVPWIAQDHTQLVLLPEDPSRANVVVEADGQCWCASITAVTDAWQLWTELPTVSGQPRVLGVSHRELRQGTTLRSGDVVSEASGRFTPWAVFSLIGVSGWRTAGPSVVLLAIGLAWGHSVGATRYTGAAPSSSLDRHAEGPLLPDCFPTCHRLWDPACGVLGPFRGTSLELPVALRDAAPAWSSFTRVHPPQDPRLVDWVPVPSDPMFATVLLQCPPATRAAFLPATCAAADLLRAYNRIVRDLSLILAPPEIWCGTATSPNPTLFLRSGDVLTLAGETWAPRLRSPAGRYWDTLLQARHFAFWGSPFSIRQPGLLFAWSPGDPVPLTVPTVRDEQWDPVHCTFRPSLACFSVTRWIPAQRLDDLGLHLVVSRQGSSGLLRDGDILSGGFGLRPLVSGSWQATARQPFQLICSFPVQGPSQGTAWLPRLILASCYLRARGAPVWSSTDGISWSADVHEECVAQASIHQLWWSHELYPFLPASAPPSYRQAFCNFPLWHGGVPDQVFIATDGSGEHGGAWAFCVWAWWRHRWYRVGWFGASGHQLPWTPDLPPSAGGLSFHTELAALQAAGLWLIAWVDRLSLLTASAPTKVTIAVDNAAALQIAAGQAQAAAPATTTTRYVWQAVQARLSTRFQHVHSHVGVLPNTFADFLAGWSGRVSWQPWKQLDPLLPSLMQNAAPWLWVIPHARVVKGRPCICLVSQTISCAPATEAGDVLPPAEDTLTSTEAAASPGRPLADSPIPLRLVTANVQTMRDSNASFFNPSGHGQRRQYLYSQVATLGLDVVCLQEARSKGGRWDTAGLLTWRSGAQKGSYGCEIWIRPGITNPPLRLDDWRIASADPRFLVIVSKRADLPIAVIAAHAPHAERPASEIHHFWSSLHSSLCQLPRALSLVLGLDANADLLWADEDHAYIGDCLGNSEEGAGEQGLFDTIQRFGLLAPASFSALQQGPGWSWEHTGGTRKRLDPRPSATLARPPGASNRATAKQAQLIAASLWRELPSPVRSIVEVGQEIRDLKARHLRLLEALPRAPRRPARQPYITAESVAALDVVRQAREQLPRLRSNVEWQKRRFLLLVWRWSCVRGRSDTAVPRPDPTGLQHARLLLQACNLHIRGLQQKAHYLARSDKLAHFRTLTLAATQHWESTGIPLESIRHLRWASRKAHDRRAVHAAGGFDIDRELEAQFRDQEGARLVSPALLSQTAEQWLSVDATRSPCLEAVPSLLQMEQMCIRQAPAKAPGPDGLRNELWREHGALAGQWLWPLCTRIALQGREPFDFKKAIVCALYKKGPASVPANYRSIALLNGIAKLWHSHLRTTVGGHVLSRYEPMQLGGRRGVHTGFALAAFRCAWDLSVAAGRCVAVVFVDIQAAYYEASRDLLFDGFPDDVDVPEHHHLAGLVLQLHGQGALSALGVAEDVSALLRDCVALSHWSLSGSDNIFLASRGSRPGDGLADVLFGALFAIGLQHIQRTACSMGISHTSAGVEIGLEPGVKPIGWADDLAVLADFDSPAELQTQLPQLTGVILDTLRCLRFRVNLGAGKTEALVDIRGDGARAARGALLSGDALLEVSKGDSIRLCPEYKYLGVAQLPRDTGRRDCELSAQRGSAAASLARTLLCSNCLPWELKRAWITGRVLPSAYSSLAFSRADSARAAAPLAGLFERTARILLSSWQVGHKLTTPLLRLLADITPPDLATTVSQCRLCVQLFCKAPAAVREIVDAAWNRAIPWCQALVLACLRVGVALDSWDPAAPPAITVLFVQQNGRALLRACKALSKFGHRYAACAQLWADLATRRTTKILGAPQSHSCPVCRGVFPSLHAVRAHMHRKHGVLSDVTAYMAGSVCLWCMRDFQSSDRLKHHLQTQRSCLHGLRVTVGPVYQYGSGTKRSGRASHRGVPPQRICGPCNATPAQRRAADLGVPADDAALQAEWEAVQRSPALSDLVPGNLHRPSSLSPSDDASGAQQACIISDARGSSPKSLASQHSRSATIEAASPAQHPLHWFSVVEGAAGCDDWALPSPWWPGLLGLGGVFQLPSSWHRLWPMWSALEFFEPWEHRAIRRFGALRSASSCGLGAAATLADATTGKWSLLELAAATVSFRMICKAVLRGGALWLWGRPSNSGLALLRRLLPAAFFLDFLSPRGRVFLVACSASLASLVRAVFARPACSAPVSLPLRAFWAYPAA